MRRIMLILIFLSCEKTITLSYTDSEKVIEVSSIKIEWSDGKNRISAFPEEITYFYNTGELFFSSLTGVIINPSGRSYSVKAERGFYKDKIEEGSVEKASVKADDGNFTGNSLLIFFSSPTTMVVKDCYGVYGRLSFSAEECRFFPDEEVLVLSGNVSGTVYPEEK